MVELIEAMERHSGGALIKNRLATFLHRAVNVGVRCAFFTLDSTVLGFGLESLGCDCCTVRVVRQEFTLEDAVEFHAFAPLQTSMHVAHVIPLGCPLI
jgi:hypothetical protein